jgi:hypothetical protein
MCKKLKAQFEIWYDKHPPSKKQAKTKSWACTANNSDEVDTANVAGCIMILLLMMMMMMVRTATATPMLVVHTGSRRRGRIWMAAINRYLYLIDWEQCFLIVMGW